VRKLTGAPGGAPAPGPRPLPSGGGGGAQALARAPEADPAPALAPRAAPEALAAFPSMAEVVALIREKRDMKLLADVEDCLRLVRYAPGRIEFSPGPGAPAELAQTLSTRLAGWTGARWMVSVTDAPAEPSITETKRRGEAAAAEAVAQHPLVAAALAAFPGARIAAIRSVTELEAAPPPPDDAYDDAEFGDDWSPVDPFGE